MMRVGIIEWRGEIGKGPCFTNNSGFRGTIEKDGVNERLPSVDDVTACSHWSGFNVG
jgi:hypothetical protein